MEPWIRKWAEDAGLSPAEAAEVYGVKLRQMRYWLAGHPEPPPWARHAAAAYLAGYTPWHLSLDGWREAMGGDRKAITISRAAGLLGVDYRTFTRWHVRHKPRRGVLLACRAILNRLPPYEVEQQRAAP